MPQTVWEYLVVDFHPVTGFQTDDGVSLPVDGQQEMLNHLGKQGWECMTVLMPLMPANRDVREYYLKRPKEATA